MMFWIMGTGKTNGVLLGQSWFWYNRAVMDWDTMWILVRDAVAEIGSNKAMYQFKYAGGEMKKEEEKKETEKENKRKINRINNKSTHFPYRGYTQSIERL
jgi:hypothetical protein